jgi:hypothetical protein
MSGGGPVPPESFARYLDSMIDDAAQDRRQVCVPWSLEVAALSLLEYLLEDVRVIPSPLDEVCVRLTHAIATRGGLDQP